jgi:hypothetical protein
VQPAIGGMTVNVKVTVAPGPLVLPAQPSTVAVRSPTDWQGCVWITSQRSGVSSLFTQLASLVQVAMTRIGLPHWQRPPLVKVAVQSPVGATGTVNVMGAGVVVPHTTLTSISPEEQSVAVPLT